MLTSITVFFVIDRMTDINGKASQVSIKTMSQNKVTTTDAITTNVTEALENRLLGTVDILLCNPPYVLTPSHEVGSNGITASWAGGAKGREVCPLHFCYYCHLPNS